MSSSDNLRTAKQKKDDEFYTSYKDIRDEVLLYKDQFHDKTVYCNCDSPQSQFVKFFQDNFKALGLKQLVATGYDEQGNGTFFSQENIQTDPHTGDCFENLTLLNSADIVVTNPPFSLFRPYLKLLVDNGKKFLILGSQNALSYNDVFSLFQRDQLRLGYHFGSFSFARPDKSVQKLGNICWYTNLETKQLPMSLSADYPDFSTYDNYDAVEIPKVSMIPYGLKGKAGVPITFLQKYCPKQFRIIGKSDQLAGQIRIGHTEKRNPGRFYLKGKRLYERIVIERIRVMQQLQVTNQDLEQAVSQATQHNFQNNLRDRNTLLRFDCAVRGFLGEILVKRYFEEHGYSVSIPEYTGGTNTDMTVRYENEDLSVEVKTSLLPQGRTIDDLESLDFKVYQNKVTDTPDTMSSDPYYKDIMVQVYYNLSKTERESSGLEDFSVYKTTAYLVGIIFKKDWLTWLKQEPRTWQYQQKTFWYCPLYLSRALKVVRS